MNEFTRAQKHLIKGQRCNEISNELLAEANSFVAAGDGTNESATIANQEHDRLLRKSNVYHEKAQRHLEKAKSLLSFANDSL